MDIPQDAVNDLRSVSGTEANELGSPNSPSDSPGTNYTPIRPPVDAVEPSDPVSPLHPRVPTPSLTVEPAEEVEHAYWAEIEEDTTTPDEEELKEINGADADYSACDCEFASSSMSDCGSRGFDGLLTPWQIRIGKTISFGTWMIPNMSLVRRLA